MRTLLILLLAGGLAWGLWSLLGTDEDEAVDALPPPSTPPTVAPPPSSEGPVATTGVLTITVRTPEGTAPAGTEAGYRFGDGERLKMVDQKGQVRFTDAPLGDIVLVAHAKGFETGTQRRFLSAGVPADVVLVLEAKDE